MTAGTRGSWLAIVLWIAVSACAGDGGPSGPSPTAVATVEVTPSSVSMNVGESRQLAASPRNAAGTLVTGKSAAWSSANAAVASVDAAGLVRGVAAGSTTVSATVSGKVGTAAITVAAVPVATVAIVTATTQVAAGTALALQATVSDAQGNALVGRTVTWSSGNTTVATVGASTGIVTGVVAGTSTITATCEGANGTRVITVIPNSAVTFAMSGRVVEAPAGTAIAGARVTATDANELVIATVLTDAGGNWTLASLASGSVLGLSVSAANFVSTTVAPVPVTGALTVENIPLARTSVATGGLSGVARNASTNQPITTGIAVEVRDGMGATTGLAILATITAADGSYSVTGLPAGTYTLTMRGAGYAQTSRTAVAAGGSTAAGQDLTLSANAAANQWRVVLSWVAAGRDLDLYLTLPGAGSARQQVYFLQPGNCAAAPFACLDKDASVAPGPETLTISQLGAGTYRFYVQNYNAPSSGSDSTLMLSGAQVRVFNAAQQVASYAVPQQGGTLWTVFELDGATGVLTPRNTMGAGGPGDPTARLMAPDARSAKSGKRDTGLRLP